MSPTLKLVSHSEHLRILRQLSSAGDHLRGASSHSKSPRLSGYTALNTSAFTSPSEIPSLFPLPPSIAADFIALGFHQIAAQAISHEYLALVASLKDKYETEFSRVDRVCNNIIHLAYGSALPQLQLRIRSAYVMRFTTTVQKWADESISISRKCLMAISLKARFPVKGTALYCTAMNKAEPKEDCGSPRNEVKVVSDESFICPYEMFDLNSRDSDAQDVVDLMPSFRPELSSYESEGPNVLLQHASPYAFPQTYPCPPPLASDSCLKILSRGLRRVVQRSHSLDVNSLTEAFSHFSASEGRDSDSDQKSHHLSIADMFTMQSSPPTSSSSSSPSSSIVSSPKLGVHNRMSPPSDPLERSIFSPAKHKTYPHKFAPAPKRSSASIRASTCSESVPQSPTPSPTFKYALSNPDESSLLSSCIEKPDESLVHSPPIPNRPSTIHKRKFAGLPTRRVLTSSSVPSPPLPSKPTLSTVLAPLSMANVSSLSWPSPPSVGPRSIIPRTPSLVSLASSDSGSTSPSSDGLDTPPSTPPPFITKFPPLISSSSLSSKSFMPTFDSAVSLQFASAKQPMKVEAALPSWRAPPFGFSTGIKREEESFSFAFGR